MEHTPVLFLFIITIILVSLPITISNKKFNKTTSQNHEIKFKIDTSKELILFQSKKKIFKDEWGNLLFLGITSFILGSNWFPGFLTKKTLLTPMHIIITLFILFLIAALSARSYKYIKPAKKLIKVNKEGIYSFPLNEFFKWSEITITDIYETINMTNFRYYSPEKRFIGIEPKNLNTTLEELENHERFKSAIYSIQNLPPINLPIEYIENSDDEILDILKQYSSK